MAENEYEHPNIEEIDSTISKLENMITKSKRELKYLEVEWFHLKGLQIKNSKITEVVEPLKTIDLDNTSEINSKQLNPISLQPFKGEFSNILLNKSEYKSLNKSKKIKLNDYSKTIQNFKSHQDLFSNRNMGKNLSDSESSDEDK